MPRKRKNILVALLVLLVLLPVGTVVSMRVMRSGHEAPVVVSGSVVRLRNFFTEIYGARVGGKVVLFDAGIDTSGAALDALVAELKATRDDVSDVFLTHGHFDHVAGSPLCRRARIHVGAPDVEMMARRVPIAPAAARWFERALPVGPIEATDPYVGRVELALEGGKKVIALPLPGHTPGSYVLFFDGVLFAGDSLQIDDGKLELCMPSFSVDVDANRRNVAALKTALQGLTVEVVCTGHQGCTPAGTGGKLLDELIAKLGG